MVADVVGSGPTARVSSLSPDRTHPISRGFACAKGTRFTEVAYHPNRVLEPLLRVNGNLGPATWSDAYRIIGARLKQIRAEGGKHAIGVYFGNPVAFNAQAALLLPAFTKALGTRNVFSAGSQDCNNKFAGARLLYGSPLIQPFPDFDRTDLAIVFGSNPYVSQASFVHLAAGSQTFERLVDRGGHVIWVDPRKTESAQRWGEHVAVRPGTDAFLLSALLGLVAEKSGRPLDGGLQRLVARARRISPDEVARRTGIDESIIERMAQQICERRATAASAWIPRHRQR